MDQIAKYLTCDEYVEMPVGCNIVCFFWLWVITFRPLFQAYIWLFTCRQVKCKFKGVNISWWGDITTNRP